MDGDLVCGDAPLADHGVVTGDDIPVAGYPVPGVEEDDIPRNDLMGGEQMDRAVPDHGTDGNAGAGHILQNAVGADADGGSDQGADQKDRRDGASLKALVEHGGRGGCYDEKQGRQIKEGCRGRLPRGGPPHMPDLPGDAFSALLRLVRGEAPVHVGLQQPQDLVGGEQMPRIG